LRNPWGSFEYKGKYDENNEEIWKDQKLRQILNYNKKDDGKFYMTIEEFIDNFDSIYVCHIKPNFKL